MYCEEVRGEYNSAKCTIRKYDTLKKLSDITLDRSFL